MSISQRITAAAWEHKHLSEIVDQFIVPMRDKPKSFSGTIPWCRIEDFEGTYLSRSKSGQCVDENTIADMNLKINPKGTVLVSCSADLGRCAITDAPLITNQTFIGLVPSTRVDNLFLYYLMSSNAERLNKMSSGTTISYLSRKNFEDFKVDIPSNIFEQRKIAEILETVDNEIQKTDEIIATTNKLKEGVMQRFFSKESAQSKNDLKKIGQIGDVLGGKRLPAGHDFSLEKTNHAYIRVVDFKDFSVEQSALRYIAEQTYEKIKRYVITKDDIYISIAGTIGRVGIIPASLSGANLTENAARIVLNKKDDLIRDYLVYFLNSEIGRRQIRVSTVTTTQPKLALNKIEQIIVPFPREKADLERAVSILRAIDMKISVSKKLKSKLTLLKKGLMQDLLSGRVRVITRLP